VLVSSSPTATQCVVAGHDTPERFVPKDLEGSGGKSFDQLDPFHCAARGMAPLLVKVLYAPTATQLVEAAHDTPRKSASLLPAGLTVVWTVQGVAVGAVVVDVVEVEVVEVEDVEEVDDVEVVVVPVVPVVAVIVVVVVAVFVVVTAFLTVLVAVLFS
jgi:hypothetical protein